MTLAAGTRLGPYEILSPLGAGGMGEVYRGRDGRLGRNVAIKVLPAEVSRERERVKRFEAEARSASSLNHPNIVTIYDTGSSEGASWIAMELIEGETLRNLLAGGSLPIKKLLHIGTQIAEGLAKAHEAGIVHRDLKPDNLMVTRDGLVKILDFGLAKLTTPLGHDSNLPTVVGTSPGVLLGTVSYMSPEQARGEAVDYHSDQFALGSILYEMATGRRSFQRKTGVDTLLAILNEEPETIASLNPKAPGPFCWIVERCLQKGPNDRYDSTRDLSRELATVRDHVSTAVSVSPIATVEPPGQRRMRRVFGAAVVLTSLIAGGWLVGRRLGSSDLGTQIPTFRQLTSGLGEIFKARFTPDGASVVYGAVSKEGPAEIFTLRIDSGAPSPLGLTGAIPLAISKGGQLALLVNQERPVFYVGTLAEMPLGAGTPRELLEMALDADWSPDGSKMAVVVNLPSGPQVQYPIGTALHEGPMLGDTVRVSPDGNTVAFMDGGDATTVDRTGNRRVLSKGWASTNGLLWSRRGDELILSGSRSMSGDRWSYYAIGLSGRERVLLSNAHGFETVYDVASDGRLLVENRAVRTGVRWQPRAEGRERDLPIGNPVRSISDDGFTLLTDDSFLKAEGNIPIHLGGGRMQDLSADGRWALALSNGSPHKLQIVPAGAGLPRAVTTGGLDPLEAWFISSEKGFVVRTLNSDGRPTLSAFGPEGGAPAALQADGYRGGGLVLSPEGDRLAYTTANGRIRIIPTNGGPGAELPGVVLEKDDELVQWSADGKYIYFVARRFVRQQALPVFISRVELASGRYEAWKTLDEPGLKIFDLRMSRDGKSYAYWYNRILMSDLYVVEGLR